MVIKNRDVVFVSVRLAKAELVLYNAKVRTGIPKQVNAEAMVVSDGKIIAIGTAA